MLWSFDAARHLHLNISFIIAYLWSMLKGLNTFQRLLNWFLKVCGFEYYFLGLSLKHWGFIPDLILLFDLFWLLKNVWAEVTKLSFNILRLLKYAIVFTNHLCFYWCVLITSLGNVKCGEAFLIRNRIGE